MQVWVIDTSSVVELRNVPRDARDRVLSALDRMVDNDVLYYPPEVVAEVERVFDVGHAWAKKNAVKATRYGHLFDAAKTVLAAIPNLIDPTKVSAVDEADPYVIALAQLLAGVHGHTPTIITDDYRTKPAKMSLSDAAGVFRFPSVQLSVFLQTQKIWPQA